MREEVFDVIVAGGGPGGSSVATALVGRGYRVLLLERESFPRFHVGESLLPACWDLWDALGVTAKIEAGGFAVKQGVNFGLFKAPEDITLLTGEFPQYFQRPYAYHVERARFDRILLDHSREQGVEVREAWSVEDVLFDDGRAVGVVATPEDGEPRSISARVVVDATGRTCLLARKLGWRRADPALKKIAYFTHYDGACSRQTDGTFMTDIHSVEGGWLWYIPLSPERVSVGAVLDSGHVRRMGKKGIEGRFLQTLEDCPRIEEWLEPGRRVIDFETVSNVSYLNDRFVGDGFVLVGDASMFIDPIFSAGVTLAMRGGLFAADAISEAFDSGDFSAGRLQSYETRIRHPMSKIFRMIYNWYDILERKDRDNIFFRSRRMPLLRERLIVLLSGGYDRVDMEALLAEA